MACYDCFYENMCSRAIEIKKAVKLIYDHLPDRQKFDPDRQRPTIGENMKRFIEQNCAMYSGCKNKKQDRKVYFTDSEEDALGVYVDPKLRP